MEGLKPVEGSELILLVLALIMMSSAMSLSRAPVGPLPVHPQLSRLAADQPTALTPVIIQMTDGRARLDGLIGQLGGRVT